MQNNFNHNHWCHCTKIFQQSRFFEVVSICNQTMHFQKLILSCSTRSVGKVTLFNVMHKKVCTCNVKFIQSNLQKLATSLWYSSAFLLQNEADKVEKNKYIKIILGVMKQILETNESWWILTLCNFMVIEVNILSYNILIVTVSELENLFHYRAEYCCIIIFRKY